MTTPASAACSIPFCAARDLKPSWRIPANARWKLSRAGKFDMMISDVRMPGLSGLETLRLARKEHATLPVLLVTAFTDVRDAVAAMRDGAVNYLAKPIDLDELLATVRQATGIAKPAAPRHRRGQDPAAGFRHRPQPAHAGRCSATSRSSRRRKRACSSPAKAAWARKSWPT